MLCSYEMMSRDFIEVLFLLVECILIYWINFQEDEENERKIKEQKKVQTNFVKRVISHPSFHNVTYRDAERMLQKFEQVSFFMHFLFFAVYVIVVLCYED